MAKSKIYLIIVLVSWIAVFGDVSWQEIDCGIRNTAVVDIHNFGEYQYASTIYGYNIYRRKVGDTVWEKVLNVDVGYTSYSFQFLELFGSLLAEKGHEHYAFNESTDSWIDSSYNLDENVVDDGTNLIRIYFAKVQISSDSGHVWEDVVTNSEDLSSIYNCDKGTFVCGWGQIYHSEDHGESWKILSSGLPLRCSIREVFSIDDTTLITSTDNGLYISKNSGKNWNLVSDEFSDAKNNVITKFCEYNNTLYALGRTDLYRFTSDYREVGKVDIPFYNTIRKTDLDVFDGKLSVAGFEGVFLYNDLDSSWEIISDGLEREDRGGNLYANKKYLFMDTRDILGQYVVLRNDLTTGVWDTLSIMSGFGCVYLTESIFNYLKIGSKYSSDYGETWSDDTIAPSLFDKSIGGLKICGDVAVGQQDSMLVISSDSGATWDTTIMDVDATFMFKVGNRLLLRVYHHHPNPFNPTVDASYTSLHYSDDSGKTVSDSISGLRNCKKILMNKNGELIAHCNGMIAISKDSGTTWQVNYPNRSVRELKSCNSGILLAYQTGIHPPKHYYNKEIIFSLDQGATWHDIYHPLTGETMDRFNGDDCIIVDSIVYLHSPKTSEAFKTTITELVKDIPVANTVKKQKIVDKLISTKVVGKIINIKLNDFIKGEFQVKIYNAAGREIKRFNGNLAGGQKRVTLKCEDLSQGFYLLKIKIGNESIVNPIMIMNK